MMQHTVKTMMLHTTASEAEDLQEHYRDKPLTFLKALDPKGKWPKALRKIFADIWTGRSGPNVIMKAPRGGGKSHMLGRLGFCLWYFKGYSVVDMGGALAQAKVVYQYFTSIIFSDDRILRTLPKDPMMEESIGPHDKNYFKCVAASPKAVRGPHPDVLMADEVCETDDAMVESAIPMVDTSQHPLRILTSTFHKVFGIFQDIWDRAEELGYTRYQWDIFDVVRTFDPVIWDDPRLNREIPDLQKLRALSKEKIGDDEGWIPILNVINAWRGKRSVDWFLTEYMGERPSVAGLVNDPIDVDASAFDPATETQYNYIKGAECILGVDWGFSSMTAVVELMPALDEVKVELNNKNYTQTPSEVIIEDICQMVEEHDIRIIYADSAGKFENNALQIALDKPREKGRIRCEVVEVVFSKEKVDMLGNYRAHFQRRKIKIPKHHTTALWQHKRYRYQEGSDRPMKKDDHVPDATMCALQHWKLGEVRSHISDLQMTSGDASPINAGLWDERF